MSQLASTLQTQVIKLGGTSQTKDGYFTLLSKLNKGKKVIVVSAIKNITNNLIKLSENFNMGLDMRLQYFEYNILQPNKNLINDLGIEDISFLKNEINYILLILKQNKLELQLQEKINLISMGETFTAKILNTFLNLNNVNSDYLDSLKFINCSLENTSIYNKGEFSVNKDLLLEQLIEKDVIVVPGFKGSNINNDVSLMGRGGSDTTGSIIAAALESNLYQIWTDVNGIYSGDPNKLDNVNIIHSISYDAAQEISAMGAKVIHPYCIKPCKEKNIPIEIRNTFNYNCSNTIIENNPNVYDKLIYGITTQDNITVFKIQSLNMWNNYGFVYDIFSKFKDFNVDVNIINTSQFDIMTTTDDTDIKKLEKLKLSLEKYYNVEVQHNCSCVSIVGENIKKYDKLNNIMNSILKFDIKLTSYSSNDMTLSFIVDSSISSSLANELHHVIFPFNQFKLDSGNVWWESLLNLEGPKECKYLYNLDVVKQKISVLKNMNSVDRVYYAMKANNNESILRTIIEADLGIETVSVEEILLILKISETINKTINILFTPNFVSIEDYIKIINLNNEKLKIITIIDNINLITNYPDVFSNRSIGIRLDLDYGFGHCNKVITQGQDSKFGVTYNDIISNINLLKKYNIKISGLHSHMGSGITDYKHWVNNMNLIKEIYLKIPIEINEVEWFDIGGGFGIGDVIEFDKLSHELGKIKKSLKNIKIFIEPGRFIVAESGIIWGKVTQIKVKNNTKFIGTNIGMTDLIRPALYSAIHPIFFKEKNTKKELVTVVGPICESGDVLIRNLLVNNSIKLNDSLVITNTGAYGFVMASRYNNRDLPEQIIY